MLTIDLGTDQVETIPVTDLAFTQSKMTAEQAQQKLDAVRLHFKQVCSAMQETKETIIQHSKQGVSLLVEIDEGLGLDKLGYKSMRRLIETELKPYFGLSTSQIYRLYNAAKIRHKVNQMRILDNCEDIPDNQLEVLNKLPVEQWKEAWNEVVETSSNITAKHVREVVERRLQGCKISDSPKTDFLNYSSESEISSFDSIINQNEYTLPANAIESKSQLFHLQENEAVPSNFQLIPCSEDTGVNSLVQCNPTTEINKVAMIHCTDSSTHQQSNYSGCWGIVQNLLQSSAIVAIQGQLVEYPFQDLNMVENLSPVVGEVCDLVTILWQFPDLPASVKHLLATFYQQRLDFSQGDLNVLKAIQKLYSVFEPEFQYDTFC